MLIIFNITTKNSHRLKHGQIQTQSLSTAALQKLAMIKLHNVNTQLETQTLLVLIEKLGNRELTIPTYLSKRMVYSILTNKVLKRADVTGYTYPESKALRDFLSHYLIMEISIKSIDVANIIPDPFMVPICT